MKGAFKFDKGGERFPQKIDKDNAFHGEDLPTTEKNIDINKAFESVKPNLSVVNFKRYEKKEIVDLNKVKKIQEEKEK